MTLRSKINSMKASLNGIGYKTIDYLDWENRKYGNFPTSWYETTFTFKPTIIPVGEDGRSNRIVVELEFVASYKEELYIDFLDKIVSDLKALSPYINTSNIFFDYQPKEVFIIVKDVDWII